MTQQTSRRTRHVIIAVLAAATMLALTPGAARAAGPCDPPVTNQVACENSKPGTPPSDWEVTAAGDPTIQGFATSMSVTPGQTVSFKIKTPAPSYHVDILRLGYYGGDGARKVAAGLRPSATLAQTQPDCLSFSSTGLIDCGNWSVSASWTVPTDAVSGVYIAHLVRDDTGGDSQIPFVVRDDASHSDMLVATSDATWVAYNAYGGNSLYSCTVACPPGNPKAYKAAYAVSYNRPFDGSIERDGGHSYLWYAEYQMIRFLERNGYDVSYTSDEQVDSNGAVLKNHKVFLASGHDEYWSAGMRSNVEAARDAGVNLAFFTGNEVFWKTRYGPSSDGSDTAGRTITSYKDTHFDAPADPVTWTGTWRDPRFSPPGSGGDPENALTGQYFTVNSGTSDITVPAQFAPLRFWRNTAVANLTAGQTLTLTPRTGTLGYEWDVDADNGFRPAGQFRLSSTTVTGVESFTDYGSTTDGQSTATHNLVMYRAPSGALVFGAGTVQWAWGLDTTNAWGVGITAPSRNPPDPNMQQATVNLFADMGAQPATLMAGLTPAAASTDTAPPTATITSPAPGAAIADGAQVTIAGTAADTGGTVAAVEVSTDGGATWHPATGTTNWTYSWDAHGSPTAAIEARAIDDSGNIEKTPPAVTMAISCPCSLFGTTTPAKPDSGDGSAVEVGVKFSADVPGTVDGVRFYKASANTGTHVGNLWTASGTNLASATFTGETASGWQTATFAHPVAIAPKTTYVVSYFAPAGHYSSTNGYYLTPTPLGGRYSLDSPPLHALGADGGGTGGGNGLYGYSATSAFPISSFQGTNYGVDVSFTPTTAPGKVSSVTATAGTGSATVSWTAPATGSAPSSYEVTPYAGATAQAPKTVSGSPAATSTTVSGLTPGQSYTFTVKPSNASGDGPVSAASNAVTPSSATAPAAPTGVAAIPLSAAAKVSWSAPDDGGSAISAYTITAYAGATAAASVTAGATSMSATVSGLVNGTAYTFTVKATNAIGTGPEASASTAVKPAATMTLLGSSAPTAAQTDSGDGSAVELGVKFTADVDGWVTGVRFYKAAANTGTHTGSLWSASGTRLASAAFSAESASGWQTASFAAPVAVSAGATYVASYFAPAGHYAFTPAGFDSALDNAPLHALANAVSANGVFGYSATSAFPAGSFNATNYWVDAVFTTDDPNAPPGAATDVTAVAGIASATVSWTAPATGSAPASYKVTPYLGGGAQPAQTFAATATSARLSGLTAGQSYTFTVTPSNGAGNGPESAPSNAVTPAAPPAATAPAAPTAVTATASAGAARVAWTAPSSDGGSAITGYTITPYIGVFAQTPAQAAAGATSATVSGLSNGTSYAFTVKATNAVGDSPESAASNAVTPAPATSTSLFGASTTPAQVDVADPNGVELGVKFQSDTPGSITGIRFYKAAANTGTHTGSLWTASGTRLATVTFSSETASGWQEADFATPVSITAGTTYVASYHAPAGHYSATGGGFASAIDNAPLHAPANGTSANGLYAYAPASVFPADTFNATNYWVDVVFSPAA